MNTQGTDPGVRPYGDTTDDGMVQMSFTLPLPHNPQAEAAALRFADKSGIDQPLLVHSKGIGPDFSFFVVYGRSRHSVDLSEIEVPSRPYPLLTPKETNEALRAALGRKAVVIGACIGTDAHTVGIDAILNLKGFAGEKGLEYYPQMSVLNLGSQVAVEELVARARAEAADAVLVSQAVTQRDSHITNVRELSAAIRAEFGEDERPLLVVGGARFGSCTAQELGVDRLFGRGTLPAEVASYLAHAMTLRARGTVAAATADGTSAASDQARERS